MFIPADGRIEAPDVRSGDASMMVRKLVVSSLLVRFLFRGFFNEGYSRGGRFQWGLSGSEGLVRMFLLILGGTSVLGEAAPQVFMPADGRSEAPGVWLGDASWTGLVSTGG